MPVLKGFTYELKLKISHEGKNDIMQYVITQQYYVNKWNGMEMRFN